MTTNQHIIDAAREAGFTDECLEAEILNHDAKSCEPILDCLTKFAELLTQPLRQELAETQAQLKDAREALREMKDLHDLAQEDVPLNEYQTIENYALELTSRVLKQPESYSALDAAIEPYRLDAERWKVLLEHVGNAPVPPKGKFYISISPSANFTSKPAEDLTAGIDAARAAGKSTDASR